MPLSGGPAGKCGDYYEQRWVTRCAFEVLQGRASQLRYEPPGTEGDGVELWLQRPEVREYHQAKRQNSSAKWVVSKLSREGVLANIWKHLQKPSTTFVFVSRQDAHELRELAEYARKSSSFEDFKDSYLHAKTRQEPFETLRKAWKSDERTTFDLLPRIEIETIDDNNLDHLNHTLAELLFEGDPRASCALLAEVLGEALHEVLYADDLWRRLAAKGVREAAWRGSPRLVTAIAGANQRYERSRESTLIHGNLIERVEGGQLAEAVDRHRVVLVLGTAGTGKSDVLLQYVRDLAARRVPHLAFRLDRIGPAEHAARLAEALDLPVGPVPALAAAAAERAAVLVIDQLDAVSSVSGRRPELLDCVEELLNQAKALPNVKVVLACRTFDVEHDPRLQRLAKQLEAHRLPIGLLEEAQVRTALNTAGLERFSPGPTQLELLRTPLHLALLCESPRDGSLSFATQADLFDRFWKAKSARLEQHGRADTWNPLLDALLRHMSDERSLTAPRKVAGAWEQAVDQLISLHVLRQEERSLAFMHESFFDYAYARRAVERGETIRSMLAQDQHLFRRAQVRQMLARERDLGGRFFHDLDFLLRDPNVRAHLRALTIEWLAQTEPSRELLSRLEPFLFEHSSAYCSYAWGVLTTAAWFDAADQAGFLERAMPEEGLTYRACWVLGKARHAQRRVAGLLRPYLHDGAWRRRFYQVIWEQKTLVDEDLFTLYRELMNLEIEDGRYEDLHLSLRAVVSHLVKELPERGAIALGDYLRAAQQSGDAPFNRFHERNAQLHLHDELVGVAQNAPAAFTEHVTSIVFNIADTTQKQPFYEDQLWDDSVCPLRGVLGDPRVSGALHDHVLIGAQTAMQGLAIADPDQFLALLREHGLGTSETIAYLFAQGFAANPAVLADEAIAWLLDDPRRFSIRMRLDSYWGARQLLHDITPAAGDDALARLQEALLELQPERDRDADAFGRTQFLLLSAVAPTRRSVEVQRRYQELHRKFGGEGPIQPRGVDFREDPLPIPASAVASLTDQDWISAISKHARAREGTFDSMTAFRNSAASSLARQLGAAAKAEPERFARLAVALPDYADPLCFSHIAYGISDATGALGMELVEALVQRFHRLPNQPCGQEIGLMIEGVAAEPLPASLYEILKWYVQNDPNPQAETDEQENLGQRGLNSVRGYLAHTVAVLLSQRIEHYSPLRDVVDLLVADRARSVRAIAAQIVLALPKDYQADADRLTATLLKDPHDDLLDSNGVRSLVARFAPWNVSLYCPIIERMLRSARGETRSNGAEQATWLALALPQEADLAQRCLASSDAIVRAAVARVYAAKVDDLKVEATCSEALRRLFRDEDTRVRRFASHAVCDLGADQLDDHIALVHDYLASPAFADDPDRFLRALKEAAPLHREAALRACEAALTHVERNVGNRNAVIFASLTPEMILRLYYEGRPTAAEQEHALDLFDRAVGCGLSAADELLKEHDREWQ